MQHKKLFVGAMLKIADRIERTQRDNPVIRESEVTSVTLRMRYTPDGPQVDAVARVSVHMHESMTQKQVDPNEQF